MDAEHVNHESGLPPYQQLANILRRQIETGEITQRLPSERTLAQMYGVSAGTCRKALALLRAGGLVRTHRGWGTEIIWQPPEDGT